MCVPLILLLLIASGATTTVEVQLAVCSRAVQEGERDTSSSRSSSSSSVVPPKKVYTKSKESKHVKNKIKRGTKTQQKSNMKESMTMIMIHHDYRMQRASFFSYLPTYSTTYVRTTRRPCPFTHHAPVNLVNFGTLPCSLHATSSN